MSVMRSPAPEAVRGGLRYATLPNLLSLMRILFLIPILYLLERPDPESDAWAFVLLVVAGLSDLLDGFVARTRHVVSPSGKIVDPLADKILIGGLVVYLAWARDFPLWLLGFLLIRDLGLMLGAAIFLRRDRVVFAADLSGKITTFFFLCLIVVYILDWRALRSPFTVAAAVALLVSYISYGRRALGFVRAAGARGDGGSPSVSQPLDRHLPDSDAAPGLDPVAIARLRRVGGDALTGKMASLFLELAPQRLSAAREGLSAGDHDAVGRAAHSLKSSAGNMGAHTVLEASGRLEEAAESRKPMEELGLLLAAVEEAFEAIRPDVADLATKEE